MATDLSEESNKEKGTGFPVVMADRVVVMQR